MSNKWSISAAAPASLFAVFLILTVLGAHDRLHTGSPALLRLATAVGLVATTLILANGTICNSVLQLARDYPQNQATAATTFRTLTLVSSNGVGLVSGGIFAYGWWALLVSWAALRTATWPRPLHYLGLVFGAAGILAIAIPALGFLGPVVGSQRTDTGHGLSRSVSWLGLCLKPS